MIASLDSRFHCINVKLPGHCGLSIPADMDNPSVAAEFEHLRQAVETLNGQPFHLVGHSYGGAVALAAALSDQFNIARLSLFEPVTLWILKVLGDDVALQQVMDFQDQYEAAIKCGDPDSPAVLIDFWSGAGAYQQLPEGLKSQMRPLVKQTERHWSIIQQSEVSAEQLHQLNTPVDLVYGTATNPLMEKVILSLNKLLANATISKIAGANHFLVTSHAKQCVKAMGVD